jgi:hypothetical protein
VIWEIPDNESTGFKVQVISDPDLIQNCCEYNCDCYITRFGGTKIEGVYVLKHQHLRLYQLVRHFVIYDGKDYIDITPFDDLRDYNWFIPTKINTYNLFVQSLECINNIQIQEIKNMYYVYSYIDPTNNQPFYVGKGTQKRAYVHMYQPRDNKNKNKTRFKNKLEKMKQENIEPIIVFLAQNIQDENIAYDIEEQFIKKYGRIGYDDGGILLNICENSRPPNHKGRTYEEIYGKRAEEQREKRHKLQLEAGGWFKGHKHTEETKQKYRQKNSGIGNPNFSKISEEEVLHQGKEFCKYFDNQISSKKWLWWCKRKNIPSLKKTFRFGGKNILDVFVEKYGAEKKFDSMLWFHSPETKQTWRCLDWELSFKQPPEGYIRGRGINTFRGFSL